MRLQRPPHELSKLEIFGLTTGIIGLVADVITLLGLLFGVVAPPPSLGVWSNPIVVAVITFSVMVYGLSICLFFIIQFARNRWRLVNDTPAPQAIRNAPFILGYGLWLPTSILWGIAILQHIWHSYNLSLSSSDAGPIVVFLAIFYFMLAVPLGGMLLTWTTLFLNSFFNP